MNARDEMPIIPELSESGKWYCVSVKPGWMGRVRGELYQLGFRTFTPELRKWVSHARKARAVRRPILSRYLFVDVDHPRQSFGTVRSVRGVDAMLSNMGAPLAFTVGQVTDFITRQMKGEWDDVAKGKIPVGAEIVVMGGPNADRQAVVTSVKGNKVSYKLVGEAASRTDYAMNVRAA